MSIFHRRFTNAEIVEGARVTNDQLQNWMKRELIIGQKTVIREQVGVEGGGGPGRHRSFSFFSLMEIAIARAILDVGGMSDLKDVFRAAHGFAHTGDGDLPGKPARIPAVPFNVPQSKTLVLAGKGWSDEVFFTAKTTDTSLAAKILRNGGCVVVDASQIFTNTLTNLGIQPSEVMREAYGD